MMFPTFVSTMVALLYALDTCNAKDLEERELTLNDAQQSSYAAALANVATAYAAVPSITAFLAAGSSFESVFIATQTIAPGAVMGETTLDDKVLIALSKEYSEKVLHFVATQTFVDGSAKKSLAADFKALLPVPGAAVRDRAGMAAVVVAGVAAGVAVVAAF
ncbi:hypothetical protein BZA05DRAFT_388109 [Tricharina praecox]|uniref:uncharacterized protein n=1 Tax=Tricharina praecox TaxID=43433 RepID=UPI00221E6B56|nr:uncharacterized protein BZA05DRAFT_388109 [Tricharina praecox]KAI5856323.1 hypothetical protein BZA05DRAFT_388109 [Tricharina praecox]